MKKYYYAYFLFATNKTIILKIYHVKELLDIFLKYLFFSNDLRGG